MRKCTKLSYVFREDKLHLPLLSPMNILAVAQASIIVIFTLLDPKLYFRVQCRLRPPLDNTDDAFQFAFSICLAGLCIFGFTVCYFHETIVVVRLYASAFSRYSAIGAIRVTACVQVPRPLLGRQPFAQVALQTEEARALCRRLHRKVVSRVGTDLQRVELLQVRPQRHMRLPDNILVHPVCCVRCWGCFDCFTRGVRKLHGSRHQYYSFHCIRQLPSADSFLRIYGFTVRYNSCLRTE